MVFLWWNVGMFKVIKLTFSNLGQAKALLPNKQRLGQVCHQVCCEKLDFQSFTDGRIVVKVMSACHFCSEVSSSCTLPQGAAPMNSSAASCGFCSVCSFCSKSWDTLSTEAKRVPVSKGLIFARLNIFYSTYHSTFYRVYLSRYFIF